MNMSNYLSSTGKSSVPNQQETQAERLNLECALGAFLELRRPHCSCGRHRMNNGGSAGWLPKQVLQVSPKSSSEGYWRVQKPAQRGFSARHCRGILTLFIHLAPKLLGQLAYCQIRYYIYPTPIRTGHIALEIQRRVLGCHALAFELGVPE